MSAASSGRPIRQELVYPYEPVTFQVKRSYSPLHLHPLDPTNFPDRGAYLRAKWARYQMKRSLALTAHMIFRPSFWWTRLQGPEPTYHSDRARKWNRRACDLGLLGIGPK